MTIDCIIVEDEPLALKRTSEFAARVPYLNVAGAFSSGLEALGFLKTHDVGLMFLDIEMDGITGIELLESLNRKPQVIITTAYDKYALKGFELHVSDYLLKPFGFDRFLSAVDRVHDLIEKENTDDKHYVFIKTEYRLERVPTDEICYIEGMGDYRNMRLTGKKILTLQTFTELENLLPANRFCRVHKSYIVSIDRIVSVERHRIRILDQLIPVSEPYRERFYRLIGINS